MTIGDEVVFERFNVIEVRKTISRFSFMLSILIIPACSPYGCSLSLWPSIGTDFSKLPDNEISDYFRKVYPNNPDIGLKNLMYTKLEAHPNQNLDQVLSDMGMVCSHVTRICTYHATYQTTVEADFKVLSRSDVDLTIQVHLDKGIPSYSREEKVKSKIK